MNWVTYIKELILALTKAIPILNRWFSKTAIEERVQEQEDLQKEKQDAEFRGQ